VRFDLKKKLASNNDASSIELLQGKIDGVEFKKSFALKTINLSSTVVVDYESTVQRIDGFYE